MTTNSVNYSQTAQQFLPNDVTTKKNTQGENALIPAFCKAAASSSLISEICTDDLGTGFSSSLIPEMVLMGRCWRSLGSTTSSVRCCSYWWYILDMCRLKSSNATCTRQPPSLTSQMVFRYGDQWKLFCCVQPRWMCTYLRSGGPATDNGITIF